MSDRLALCFRCEHRAEFLETGRHPRYECGDVNMGVVSCYMYKPAAPLVTTAANKDDKRPLYGPAMIAGRIKPVRVAEGKYKAVVAGDEITVYWEPEGAGE